MLCVKGDHFVGFQGRGLSGGALGVEILELSLLSDAPAGFTIVGLRDLLFFGSVRLKCLYCLSFQMLHKDRSSWTG